MGKPLFFKTMNFNYSSFINPRSNNFSNSSFSNGSPIYSSFIPRVSIHDQIQIGQNALGKTIYLDSGRF